MCLKRLGIKLPATNPSVWLRTYFRAERVLVSSGGGKGTNPLGLDSPSSQLELSRCQLGSDGASALELPIPSQISLRGAVGGTGWGANN